MIPFVSGKQWESSSFGSSPITAYISATSQSIVHVWSGSVSAFVTGTLSSVGVNWISVVTGAAPPSASVNGNTVVVSTFQNQIYNPGLIESLVFTTGSSTGSPSPIITGSSLLSASFNNIRFSYGIVSSSGARQGIYVNARTGSPQLSLEPLTLNPSESYAGDFWYVTSSMYVGGDGGYRVIDIDQSNGIYTARLLQSRINETSSVEVVSRFDTIDAPVSSTLGLSSVIVDDWFVTTNRNSGSFGSGWRNATWGGGIYMPNETTVAIYGQKNFAVSGTISASSYIGTIESASYALVAQNVLGSITSASYAETSSYAVVAQNVLGSITSASYALTASFAVSASWAPGGTGGSGEFASSSLSSSWASSSLSSSYAFQATSASWAPGGDALFASSSLSSSWASSSLSSSYATTSATSSLTYQIYNTQFSTTIAPSTNYQTVMSGTQWLGDTGVYTFGARVSFGDHDTELYSGQFSWYTGSTNSTVADEILVHKMGISPGSSSLYFRTRRQAGNLGVFELASTHNYVASGTVAFTFVKIL